MRRIVLAWQYTTLCMLLLLGVGCTSKQEKNEEAKAVDTEQPMSPEQIFMEDLVGNWRLDFSRSQGAGLKALLGSKASVTMLFEPDGKRTVYRNGQPIEVGIFTAEELRTQDGNPSKHHAIGSLSRGKNLPPLRVQVSQIDEEHVEWKFEEGNRLEYFEREEMTPSEDYKP